MSDDEHRPDDTLADDPTTAPRQIELAELPAPLQAAVARVGWTDLMPCQRRTLPYLLDSLDVMCQSRTGSGKTAAFLLPILERLDPTRESCQALVLVPTRELCRQVADEAEKLFAGTGLRTVAVYGGVGYGSQLEGFRQGAHLVVGTPGRVLDHLLRRSLSLHDLEILIFDEADRMLSMGFYPDMKRVQRYLPGHRLTVAMFSATFPPYVLRLAREFMSEPATVSLSSDNVHVAEVDHRYYQVDPMDRDRTLVRIIELENPTNALIFCNTKQKVHYLTTVLQRFGYDADELTADLAQNARERVMERIRRGQLRFLVATDVAARGIDLPELSHVIQYEPPEDKEAYIHRAGRTGRAGAAGTAITLVANLEVFDLQRLAKSYNIDLVEVPSPTDEDVEAVVGQRVTALLEAALRDRDKLRLERMRRFLALARELGENDDELAVMAMLIDDFYQQSLHAAPALDEADQPERRSTERSSNDRPPRRRNRRR